MFRRISLFVLIVVLALSVGRASAAAKVGTIHFATKGLSAYAFFSSVDETGCIETYADLNVTDGRVKQTGKPEVISEVFIFISQYDYCTDESIIEAFGFASLAPDDFVINKQLDAATLQATITVYDYISDAEYPVLADVTWTGTEGVYQQRYHTQYRSPGFRYNYRSMGTFRGAEATGSVIGAGIEFAAQPAGYAELANAKSGEVDIIKVP